MNIYLCTLSIVHYEDNVYRIKSYKYEHLSLYLVYSSL
jgi:hypothetical protein